jgi:FAD/FMN-containing dehydrogenase
VLSITWYKTDAALTIQERLQPKKLSYLKEAIGEILVRRIPFFKKIRAMVESLVLQKPEVVWRNYEMSYTVESLKQLYRFPVTSVLQEYFIPVEHVQDFIEGIERIIKKYNINVLNISLRYVPGNKETVLAYAPQNSFACVFYINMVNTASGREYAKQWTRALIDCALKYGGTYYLPYQLYATNEQIRKAYPHFDEFLQYKTQFDPTGTFNNMFYAWYGDTMYTHKE